jgi:hypothetical protein
MRDFARSHCLERQAAKIGMSGNVLRNKLNPDQEFHKLSLVEATILASNTGDLALFDGALNMLGKGIHDISKNHCSESMLSFILGTVGATGKVAKLFDDATADNHIDPQEATEIISEVDKAISKLQGLRTALQVKKVG